MQHVLTAKQFTRTELAALFKRTDVMYEASASREGRLELLNRQKGMIMAALFYEPSTRTRMSFVSAAERLGMSIIETENAAEFSSAAKGETIEDSTRVVGSYADVVVMRHKENGAAERAASVSPVPVINAGDGTGEHPTQALLDLYTIQHELGRLEHLQVVVGGDLKHGRTVRSLAQLLALYPGNKLIFVSTPELQIGDDIKAYLKSHDTAFVETADLHAVLGQADVVYWTRLQKERLSDPRLEAGFNFGKRELRSLAKRAIIMHPLPRVGEIAVEVDIDPRAAYFRQAENGLYVRMALLDTLVEGNVR